MPIVELQHVRKVYDTKVAVDDISFTIEPGTMFGLLGPNGSGKTSSIRMMIGITVPDSGSVRLFNQPFDRKSLKRVGYLPEERGLYKKMKVMDQLIFLGQLHGLDATVASKRAHAWCERMQISEAIPKKTEELSKGMQQKIQFIAALLHDPELIIMDEPFSGLDPVNATLLQDTLIELRQQGKAVLFSTHRMDQVERMCDSICLIHNGNVVLSGAMREVKSRYPVNRIHIAFTGDDGFLRHPAIASAKNYNGQAEIILRTSADTAGDAQLVLADAVGRGSRISKFELMEPTLEEIFIETVGGNPIDMNGRVAVGSLNTEEQFSTKAGGISNA
jgi:ABC-2 type transport system ATP-binding protein